MMIPELIKNYMEPHRVYHTLDHIYSMFQVAQEHNIKLSDEQVLAILFHDAIYIPGRQDNEAKSAECFMEYCFNLKTVPFDADIVKTIILETKGHVPSIEESKIVLDLDLYGISQSDLFNKNSIAIKKEFQDYLKISDTEYYTNNLKWIESQLKKEKIYYSDIFNHCNKLAKDVLLKEKQRMIEILENI